jgi:hypothetical protein
MADKGIYILGGIGVLAYLTRSSWLPTAEADFPSLFNAGPTGTGATGNNPTAPTMSLANQPISVHTPGAVPVGNDGCFLYTNGTAGGVIMNCPPGVSPPPTTPPPNNCAAGFTQDAGGICTRYPDALLLANLNTIPWTGLSDIPSEQINRIDPQILAMYSTTTGVNAGTALAYMLGLGGPAADGTIMNGSDGFAYKSLASVYYKQGPSTHTTVNGVNMGRLGAITRALPITAATLIMASSDPAIAALVGRDQRAMLTAAQWNFYYTQATGIMQGIPLHPADMQGALMSAEQYQARRAAAGLQTVTNLGTLRPARRGAFPLGAINQWIPPGNRTIYQIPGRGAVPAGRGGGIPGRRKLGLISDGGGDHRSARSPFPRPSWWREAE